MQGRTVCARKAKGRCAVQQARSSPSVRGWMISAPTQMHRTESIPRQNAPPGGHCACGPTTGPAAPLSRHCPDGSVPLTGRQPELEYYQTTRSDARRTIRSWGSAALHLQACPKIPRRGHAGGITEKGVQNRRFWCVFAYFLHKQKVGPGSGAGSARGSE